MGELSTLDLEEIINAGDSQAWSLDDWNWDAINFTATPKHDIPPSSCRAGKRQRSGDGSPAFLNNSLQDTVRMVPVEQGFLGGCQAFAKTGLLGVQGSQLEVPVQPAAWPEAACSAAADSLLPLDSSAPQGTPSRRSASSISPQERSADSAESPPSEPLSEGQSRAPQAASDQLPPNVCQADGCGQCLATLSAWHRRCHVCEVHHKAQVFTRSGAEMRFCQQCGRAHELSAFEGRKHSCRDQLAKHNARRRKRQGLASASASPGKATTKPAAAPEPVQDTGRAASLPAPVTAPCNAAASLAQWGLQTAVTEIPHAASHSQLPGIKPEVSQPATTAAASWPSQSLDVSSNNSLMWQGCTWPASIQQRAPLQALPAHPSLQSLPMGTQQSSFPPPAVHGTQQSSSADAHTVLGVPYPAGMHHTQTMVLQQGSAADLAMPLSEPMSIPPSPSSTPAWLGGISASPAVSAAFGAAAEEPLPCVAPLGDSFEYALAIMGSAPQQQQQQQQQLAVTAPPQQSDTGPQQLQWLPWALPVPQPQPRPQQREAQPALYFPENLVVRLSVKLFNCTPTELPSDLRQQLTGWLKTAPAGAEGYMRPGCVHLTLQAHMPRAAHAAVRAKGVAAAVDHLVQADPAGVWGTHAMLAQLGDQLALVKFGQLVAVWDLAKGSGAANALVTRLAPTLPAIHRISPVCLTSAAGGAVHMSGANLADAECTVLCRCDGGYVAVEVYHLPASSGCSDQGEKLVVQLPPNLTPGTAFLEVQKGAFVSRAQPVLIVGNRPALAAEVNSLAARLSGPSGAAALHASHLATGSTAAPVGGGIGLHECDSAARDTLEGLLEDLGVLCRHQHSIHSTHSAGEAAQDAFADAHVARTAAELAVYACNGGLPEIAALALAMASEVSRMEDCCLVRADGLTLLHRAVRAGSPATVQAVLEECPCMVLGAGPAGITPLHLAALVHDNGATATRLVRAALPEAATAWFELRTPDGLSPADFAMRAGQPGVNGMIQQLQLTEAHSSGQLQPQAGPLTEAACMTSATPTPQGAFPTDVPSALSDELTAAPGSSPAAGDHPAWHCVLEEPGTPPLSEPPALHRGVPSSSSSRGGLQPASAAASEPAPLTATFTAPTPTPATVPGAGAASAAEAALPLQPPPALPEMSLAPLHFDIEAAAPAAAPEHQPLMQVSCATMYACRPRAMTLQGSLFGQRPTIALLAMVACVGSCIVLLHGWAM